MRFSKSYVSQWHLPLIIYGRMQHLKTAQGKVGEDRSSGGKAPSHLMVPEDTEACDSASLETVMPGPWGSLLLLEWNFFSHSLGEIFSWQTGTNINISQLMDCSLQHWPICRTSVSFGMYLHCPLLTFLNSSCWNWDRWSRSLEAACE